LAKKYLNVATVDGGGGSSASSYSIIDDTVSQFDLIMDELVDNRTSRLQNENVDDEKLCELALYIQKNSRLKLILLSDSSSSAAELKFDNIIKIVSFVLFLKFNFN
jgi:hypothetical protein